MKLLICDLDGTLIDTLDDLTTSLNLTLEPWGVKMERKTVEGLIGNGATKLLIGALEKFGISREQMPEVYEKYTNHYLEHICDTSEFYPNVREVLEYARAKGMKIAIATMKPIWHTQRLLEVMDIGHLFDMVITRDDMELPKPDPWCVNHIAEKLAVEKSEILYLGDSLSDTGAALRAEVTCVAVTYGYCESDVLAKSGAHYFIDDFRELKKYI